MAVQTPKKSSALPWPALVPLGHHAGKSAISLKKTVILVGSRHNAHLHLLSRHVSKAHALILNDGGRSYIRDLASREQIYVNGVAEREAWLNEGDLLKIGSFTFKFKEGPAGAGARKSGLPDAVLAVEGVDAPLAIAEKVMLIGRRATCDISLIEASVSTAHAVMFDVEGKRYLRDLGSRTGTWVNGAKIHQVELSPGDSIKIGETEMRYELAAAHDHGIEPVEEAGNGELDELEHLVGTARLDMVSEMKKAEPLSPDLEADLRSMFGAGAESKPAKDDDLIELELTPEPAPTPKPAAKAPPEPAPVKPVAKEAPRPQPKALPVEEPIELEPEADAPIELEPAAPVSQAPQADWEEIDLSTDPDVSDIPSAADTRALGMEFDREPAKPTLSPRVVDEPVEVKSVEAERDEHVLLGNDLHVTGARGTADPAEEVTVEPAKTEAAVEANWPADLAGADEADSKSETSEANDLGLRGWQKSSHEEEALPEVEEAPAAEVIEESRPEAFSASELVIEELPAMEPETPAAAVVEETSALEATWADTISVEPPVEESAVDVAEDPAIVEMPAEEGVVSEVPATPAPTVEMPLVDSGVIDLPPMEEAAAAAVLETGKKKKGGRKTKAEREAEAKAKAAEAKAEAKAAKKKAAELKAAQAKEAKEKAAAARAEAKRLADEKAAAEKAEAQRIAEETAAEAKRLADEEAASGTEAKRLAEEQAAVEAEARQIAEEKAAAEEAEAKRLADERAASEAEAERIAREKAAAEAKRIADERAAAEAEAQRLSAEKAAAEEAEAKRIAQERDEAEARRIADEKAAAQDAEAKRLTEEKAAAERAEAKRIADEKAAQVRAARIAQEKAAAERAAEAKRIADEKAEAERAAAESAAEERAATSAQEIHAFDAESQGDETGTLAADAEENLEEVLELDEADVPPAPSSGGGAATPIAPLEFSVERATASEDDFFSDMADTMPVLELDAAELEPSASHRDPDVLLALDQVDPDGLDEIEVIEPTEPTLDSAMDLEAVADAEAVSPQQGEASLTDSVFGRQIEEFSADSNGELIEDLPEIEEVLDSEEELAMALDSADEAPAAEPAQPQDEAEAHEAAPPHSLADAASADEVHSNVNVTDGGIEPSALGAVSDETLNWQDFGATGESVRLDTPGNAGADAVLGGQTFVGEGSGQDVRTPVEEIHGQSFVARGESQVPPPRNDRPPGPLAPAAHTPPSPPPPGAAGMGMGGGFVMGADLSSFIGGMPLVLPDLAPPITGFGRAQVSFAGARSTWDQANRPSFPMGQSLAEEMMDAAEGLRDAEAMDDDVETEPGPDENAINDEGAPGDEWNVAGILDNEDYPSPLEEWVSPGATTQPPIESPVTPIPAAQSSTIESVETGGEQVEELSDGLEAFEGFAELPEVEPEPQASESLPEALPELEELQPFGDQSEVESAAEPEAELPELESIDELEPFDEPALASQDTAELESLETAAPASTVEELATPQWETADVGADAGLHAENPESQTAQVEATSAEADLRILPEADSASTFSEDELLLELDASAAPDVLDPPAGQSITINENLIDDLSIESIKFDEQAIEPAPEPPRAGAIEEAVADLEIDKAAEAQSLVDRSPPPPAAPVKGKSKPKLVPPPPARSLRARRGAPAKAPADASPPADPVFGSLEHGSTVAAPYAGMPSVRDVDVFSQASSRVDDAGRAPESGVFGGQMLTESEGNGPSNGDSHRAAAGGKRPQRVIVPPRMGVVGVGAAVAEAEAGEPLTRPAYRVVPRRSSGKRVLLVVILMLVFMGLAALGILHFVHPRQTSSGKLEFQGTESLTKLERTQIRDDQFARLTSPRILSNARDNAAAMGIELGFLKDTSKLKGNLTAQWPEDRPSVMTVDYVGSDPDDKKRVFALLSAMHQENAPVLDKRIQLKATIGKIEKELDEIHQMRDDRAAKKKIVDAAPSEEDIQKLNEKVAEADQAYTKADSELNDARLEASRVQEQLTPSLANKPPAPGDPKAAASDPELTDLQKSIVAANEEITKLKASTSEEADAKRKALYAAIESFQQTAAGVMKESPQLAQYVLAVQKLQEKTHKLGGDLIEVQQQTHSQLSDFKERLDDQMQARRTEIWASDKGLSDFRSQLDLAERGYNAGLDVGLNRDSPEILAALAKVNDLKDKIEARKMSLGNDPMFTGLANDLQEMIKINHERLVAARQHIEKDIKDEEQAFAQRNIVEQLPDTQRTQAAALKASQEHVNELRKQYAAALDSRTAESNASLRELEAKVADLSGKLDERKRVLATKGAHDLTPQRQAQLKVVLEQKQLAVKKANEEATDTRKLRVNRDRALQVAIDKRTESAGARVDLETLNQGLAGADDREGQDKRTLDQRRNELKSLVTIQKPVESDVQILPGNDDRWRFIAFSEAGLAVVFAGILAALSLSGAKHQHYEPLEEEELPEAETGPLAIQEIGRRAPRNAKSAVG